MSEILPIVASMPNNSCNATIVASTAFVDDATEMNVHPGLAGGLILPMSFSSAAASYQPNSTHADGLEVQLLKLQIRFRIITRLIL